MRKEAAMKRLALLMVITGVIFVQQASLGHKVYIPNIYWASHGYGCGTCNYYQGDCIFYAGGNSEAVVPAAPVYQNTSRTLNGKWYWNLGKYRDNLHPTNNISYKWCSMLEWRKPNNINNEVLEDKLTGGAYYISNYTPADDTWSFTDSHLPNGFSRTMSPTGEHTLVATGGINVYYPESNTYTCTSGWHSDMRSDAHTFTVQ
jgi:hypothetical protein